MKKVKEYKKNLRCKIISNKYKFKTIFTEHKAFHKLLRMKENDNLMEVYVGITYSKLFCF